MRVKINDTWYDSYETPICLHMHPTEKDQIAAIDPKIAPELKFAIVPEDWTNEQALEWMEVRDDY